MDNETIMAFLSHAAAFFFGIAVALAVLWPEIVEFSELDKDSEIMIKEIIGE
jgi:Kef-type K+ transport system membrane component KefB